MIGLEWVGPAHKSARVSHAHTDERVVPGGGAGFPGFGTAAARRRHSALGAAWNQTKAPIVT